MHILSLLFHSGTNRSAHRLTGIFLLFFSSFCFSQGNGGAGDVTVTTTLKTDNIKVNLTPGSYAASTLTLTIPSNPGFAAGDKILVIQMLSSSGGTGWFNESDIASVSGSGPYTLTLAAPLTRTFTQNTGTGNVVQVIRINQYRNLTIQPGAVLTCDAWNGSTGGVVDFYVSGILNVKSGGKIDVSGLGYRGGNAGSGGAGGSGGPGGSGGGANASGGSGGSSATGGTGGTGVGAGAGGTGGGKGTTGGTGVTGTAGEGPGGGSTTVAAGNSSVYLSTMVMGGGGSGGVGGNGGDGAGGGGGGGGALLLNPGSAGAAGGSGGSGGTGGSGGNGGGILRVVADTLVNAGQILANGLVGGNGGNGANGSNGGNGGGGGSLLGIGGIGGGGGGGGKGANGGNGGMGGGGGAGGIVWVFYNQNLSGTGTVSTAAGARGTAGAPGNQGCGGSGGSGGTGLLFSGNPGSSGSCGSTGTFANNMSGLTGLIMMDLLTLPVSLTNFHAAPLNNGSIQITWTTASEVNSRYFNIERASDAEHFVTVISGVPAAGNANSAREYLRYDETPVTGTSYYRLKSVDVDGSYTYSHIVSVSSEKATTIALFPNPSDGRETKLKLESEDAEDITVTVADLLGKQVHEKSYTTSPGSNLLDLELPELVQGRFIVNIIYASGKPAVHKQLIVQ